MNEAAIRAVQTHSILAAIERLSSETRTRVLEGVEAGTLLRARDALPIAWVPMSLHMAISDSLRDVVGPARNVEVWRSAMDLSYERPLLRSFVSLTVGIFGLSPGALFRRASKMYGLITQHLGTLEFHPAGERGGTVELAGFPADKHRFVCYVEGLAGCLEATLAVCKVIGSVDVVDHDDRGRARYAVNWSG